MTGLDASFLHRTLLRCAFSGAHVFAWVFAFHYYYTITGRADSALASVALAYALAHVLGVLLTPLTARSLRKGSRKPLVLAVLLAALAFFLFGAALAGIIGSVAWGIGLFAGFIGLYRAFYWVPYRVSAATRPRIASELIIALMPLCAGLALATWPEAPVALFFAAGGTALAAALPVYRMPDVHEGYSLGYRETFHELFDRRHRDTLVRALLNGFEAGALLLLWPILVFSLLEWSYALLGAVISATLIATMCGRWLLEKLRVRVHTRPVVHAVIAASAWILRGSVATPLAIVLVDVYGHAGSSSWRRGMDIATLEHAADSHSFVDEATALREVGQGLGRILFAMALVALLSLGFLTASVAILLTAAGAAGISAYLSYR